MKVKGEKDMTKKEVKALSNEELIAQMFYYGIACSNEKKPAKSREQAIARVCKELEERGIVEDALKLYERTLN